MFLCTKSTEILHRWDKRTSWQLLLFKFDSCLWSFKVSRHFRKLLEQCERIFFQWNNIFKARQEMYDHQSSPRFLLWSPPCCSFSMKKLSKLFQGQERHPRIKTLIPCSATQDTTSTGRQETEIEIRRQRGLANTWPTRRQGAARGGPRGVRHVVKGITTTTCQIYTCPEHRKSRGHVDITVMTPTTLWTTEKSSIFLNRYFCCLKVERKILMFIIRHTLPNLVV